jgi:L-alanine-DL-glutamate epimerase-like enolase superfamily enzyme
MIADRPALAGGFYTPGEGAGWGITLEMEQLDRYRIGR